MSDIGSFNTNDILPKSQGGGQYRAPPRKKRKNGKIMMIKQKSQRGLSDEPKSDDTIKINFILSRNTFFT